MINTSIFKRGLRQLRLKLQSPSISNKKIVDRIAIRKKVLSLHEFESADDETISDSDWGVGSKFQMEAFQFNEPTKKISRIVNVPCDNSLESILKFINESSETDDLRIYKYEEDSDSDKVPQIILTLSSTLQSKLKKKLPRAPYETCRVVWHLKYLFKTVFNFALSCLVALLVAFEIKAKLKKIIVNKMK